MNNSRSRAKILVVAGASGGHIFPALSFLERLKDRYDIKEVLLVLPYDNRINQSLLSGFKVSYISISKVKLELSFQGIFSLFNLFKGAWESVWLLLSFNPDIVVGFGSLVSIPMIIFAWFFRIETLIHEQNVLPGRANKFLARFVDKIAISFKESEKYFINYKSKLIFTGNPLRKEMILIAKDKALDFFRLKHDRFTILVMGGSQASHRINTGFLKAVSELADRSSLQVIHLTGYKDRDLVEKKYQELGIEARCFNFLDAMQYAYSACDLVLSRAGATSISEIIFFQLPAIIVPYPFAYQHQLKNGQVLKNNGSAFIIEDSELEGNRLKEIIETLLNNIAMLKRMRANYTQLLMPRQDDLLSETAVSQAFYHLD
jgi:UDP-N-acetylglucosamine--N-acetylmuramyl-(pentapeptide) pyrophosphoryl-undecaprenol N-acetylglucosamine transferase